MHTGQRSRLWWFITLLLIPVLACNLPSRQPSGLPFGTDQPPISATSLPGYASQATQAALFAGVPSSPQVTQEPAIPISQFSGMATATPGPGQPADWLIPDPATPLPPSTYISQSGDTLAALAARFGVSPDQISPLQPSSGLLNMGQTLMIPNLLGQPPYPSAALPDSAIIYSPAEAGFRIDDFIR